MEPLNSTINDLADFINNIEPLEPVTDAQELTYEDDLTLWEGHLTKHYGPIGSSTRDEYEQGRLEFFKTIETDGDLEFVIPENLD